MHNAIMENETKTSFSQKTAGIVAGIFSLLVFGYWGVNAWDRYKEDKSSQEAQILRAQETLDIQAQVLEESRRELERLRALIADERMKTDEETTKIADRLEDERQKRIRAEAQQERVRKETEQIKRETDQKISALEKDLTAAKKTTDLTALIQKWRPRVSHIECFWRDTQGRLVRKSGSGFLFGSDLIATNRHVVQEQNVTSAYCEITLPDDPEKITINASNGKIAVDEKDFALIDIHPTARIQQMAMQERDEAIAILSCKKPASAGDQVVILGYPSIGASADITATDGIISGYEQFYYITSAKLEQGNSGGAAIHVKNDCYLGIPTFVRVGSIESLGRILDFSKVIPKRL